MTKKKNSLSAYEVSIIKRLLVRPENFQNQEITGMINRSRGDASKDVSTGRISNIKKGQIQKYKNIAPASNEIVDKFLATHNDPVDLNSTSRVDTSPTSQNTLAKLLPLKAGSETHFDITETERIECKKGFDLPMKTVAAFANNKGGYLVLGVIDKTWEISGISKEKLSQFDFNKWNQTIRSSLGIEIEITKKNLEFGDKTIAVFYIARAHTRPVIFLKENKGYSEGSIYYRYLGEDRLIAASDLNKIIEERVKKLSETVLSKHLSNILRIGVENAAILDLSVILPFLTGLVCRTTQLVSVS